MAKREKMNEVELRQYLESLPCPFYTNKTTDETLSEILHDLYIEMDEWYEWEKDGSVYSEDVDEHELETLEKLCIAAGIPYWEDI